MTTRLQQMEEELSRFQPSVREEFHRAVDAISRDLTETELLSWAQYGLDIAQQSVRSWETASEYYRATPQVKPYLDSSQLSDWGRSGAALCLDSPTLGTAFFRASSKNAGRLKPAYVQEWANLGRGLYRGTWKSGALAAKFFEVSSEMLEYMTFQELGKFAQADKFTFAEVDRSGGGLPCPGTAGVAAIRRWHDVVDQFVAGCS